MSSFFHRNSIALIRLIGAARFLVDVGCQLVGLSLCAPRRLQPAHTPNRTYLWDLFTTFEDKCMDFLSNGYVYL